MNARNEAARLSTRGASLRLDARLANDLSPFRGFGPELRGTLFGRIADWLEAERRHPLPHAWQRDRLGDLAMKQRDDFLGRSSWNDDGEPRLALHVRIARFRHGWYVRQRLRSHLGCYRQRAQLAFLDLRCGRHQ